MTTVPEQRGVFFLLLWVTWLVHLPAQLFSISSLFCLPGSQMSEPFIDWMIHWKIIGGLITSETGCHCPGVNAYEEILSIFQKMLWIPLSVVDTVTGISFFTVTAGEEVLLSYIICHYPGTMVKGDIMCICVHGNVFNTNTTQTKCVMWEWETRRGDRRLRSKVPQSPERSWC